VGYKNYGSGTATLSRIDPTLETGIGKVDKTVLVDLASDKRLLPLQLW
jgi:hypothetical protein